MAQVWRRGVSEAPDSKCAGFEVLAPCSQGSQSKAQGGVLSGSRMGGGVLWAESKGGKEAAPTAYWGDSTAVDGADAASVSCGQVCCHCDVSALLSSSPTWSLAGSRSRMGLRPLKPAYGRT